MTCGRRDRDRLCSLVVTPWYPSVSRPVDGIFVRDVARAIADRHEVAVLFAEPAPPGTPLTRSDRIENGLRTVRISFRPLPTARTSLLLRLLAFALGSNACSIRAFGQTCCTPTCISEAPAPCCSADASVSRSSSPST